MNALIVTPLPPLPMDSGGQVRIYDLIRCYPDNCNLHLLSFTTYRQNERLMNYGGLYNKALRELFTSVTMIDKMSNIYSGWKKLWIYIRCLLSDIPLGFTQFYSDDFVKVLSKIVKEKNIDVVQFENLYLTPYSKYLSQDVYTILSQHNIESSKAFLKHRFRSYNIVKQLINNFFMIWNAYVTKKYEFKMLKNIKYIITISKHDQLIMETKSNYKNIIYIPVVFTSENKLTYTVKKDGTYNITFIGGLDWYPNKEGILWFLKKVYPHINHRKDIKIHIVGSMTKEELKDYLPLDKLIIHGFVEEIEPIFLMTDVFVVPTRIAGGISIKLLEALSYGIPTVCTDEISSHLQPMGEPYLKSTSKPKTFASLIENLLDSYDLRLGLSNSAKKYIFEYHNFNCAKQKMKEMINNLTNDVEQ